MKLTPWFPGHIKPARPGVYQLESGLGTVGFQRWDGESWSTWFYDADRAALATWPAAEEFQNDPWRGLAEDPSESGPGGFFQSREALDMGQGKP